MNILNIASLSKDEIRLIANIKGVKVKKALKKYKLFKILRKNDKITYNESPLKSIILDIRSISPKKGYKKI